MRPSERSPTFLAENGGRIEESVLPFAVDLGAGKRNGIDLPWRVLPGDHRADSFTANVDFTTLCDASFRAYVAAADGLKVGPRTDVGSAWIGWKTIPAGGVGTGSAYFLGGSVALAYYQLADLQRITSATITHTGIYFVTQDTLYFVRHDRTASWAFKHADARLSGFNNVREVGGSVIFAATQTDTGDELIAFLPPDLEGIYQADGTTPLSGYTVTAAPPGTNINLATLATIFGF